MTQHPYEAPQPPRPPQPAAPAAKKRRKWPWILGGLVVLIIVSAVASNGGTKASNQPAGAPAGNEAPAHQQPPQAANHTVVYKVAGTAKTASNITYVTDGMTTTNQESSPKLPWSKTITLPAGQALQMVSISAQGPGKGTIDVTIEVDGKPLKEAHADGYGVAMANGNIGTMG